MESPLAALSHEALRVLTDAQAEAHRLKHEYVGPEHLLLGLVSARVGFGPILLRSFKVDQDGLRKKIEEQLEKGRATAPDASLPLTSRSKTVLELARAEARRFGRSEVASQDILVGLLSDEKGIAGQVLAAEGLEVEALRAELRRIDYWFRHSADDAAAEVPPPTPVLHAMQLAEEEKPAERPRRFAIVADLDEVDTDEVVELLAILNRIHRAWGGRGLEIETQQLGHWAPAEAATR